MDYHRRNPSQVAPVFLFMTSILPDILSVLGLVCLVTGVAMVYGIPWALIVAGIVLLVTGVTAAIRRSE